MIIWREGFYVAWNAREQVKMDHSNEVTERILIVESSPEFAAQFAAAFDGHFRIACAGNGPAALEILNRESFDAVIVDHRIGGYGGFDVLKGIRASFPELPVIFYSDGGDELAAGRAFLQGASDYFIKDQSLVEQKEKVVRIYNSIRNAIERIRISKELRHERDLLNGFIAHNPYSMSITDRDGHFFKANLAYYLLFGIVRDRESIFSDPMEYMDVERLFDKLGPQWMKLKEEYSLFEDPLVMEDEGRRDALERLRKGETVRIPAHWYPMPAGSLVPPGFRLCLSLVIFPLKNSRDENDHYVLMMEDVTDQARAEEELTRSRASLRASHEMLERKVEKRTLELRKANRALRKEIAAREAVEAELIARNARLDDFAHGVSHDIQNGIMSVRRILLNAGKHPDSLGECVKELLEKTDSLMEFVENLLERARAEKAKASRER